MARSVAEIYNRILQEKESQASLNALFPDSDNYDNFLVDLDTKSKVSIWRLWVYLIAVAHFMLETYWDMFRQEVETLAKSAIPGTDPWWIKMCYMYQDGDTIEVINYAPGYITEDLSKRIIKIAAIDKELGIIKVATDDGAGNLVKLSAPQYERFKFYTMKVRIAGTQLTIISENADLIKFSLAIKYDALLSAEVVKANVISKINEFIKSVPFDGSIDINDLIVAIRAVEGVKNAYVSNFQAKPDVAALWLNISQSYSAFSGYFVLDPAFDLEANITMTAI